MSGYCNHCGHQHCICDDIKHPTVEEASETFFRLLRYAHKSGTTLIPGNVAMDYICALEHREDEKFNIIVELVNFLKEIDDKILTTEQQKIKTELIKKI